jgi:iron complex transport system permease protein
MLATLKRIGAGRTGVLAALSGLLVLLFLFSLTVGAVPITLGDIFRILFGFFGPQGAAEDTHQIVLLSIRLPRLLFTVLIGGALGVAGAALQGLFRNPLVEPGIIGVSGGAALGAILVIMGSRILGAALTTGHIAGQWLLPAFAFAGGVAATLLTLRLATYEGKTYITILILAGVAISSLVGAAIGLSIFYADDQQLRSYSFWTLGDLGGATWSKVRVLAPALLLAVTGLAACGRALNALALGEAEAGHAGISVERLKMAVVLLCALAVGTSVAFAGIIGFVGLVVPHMVRMFFSSDNELVLPASALAGASLLLLADMFARTVVAPAELPIGIVTAALGAPFFVYLLISAKKKRML